jgi:hypothetical protein
MTLIKVTVVGILKSLSNFDIISADPDCGIFDNMMTFENNPIIIEHVNIASEGVFCGIIDDTKENITNFLLNNPSIALTSVEEVTPSNVTFDFESPPIPGTSKPQPIDADTYAKTQFFDSWEDIVKCTRSAVINIIHDKLNALKPIHRLTAFRSLVHTHGLYSSESTHTMWKYNLMGDDTQRDMGALQ